MTAFLLAAAAIWGFALAVIAVACWLEPDHETPTREQAEWELHCAEAIRQSRDNRINTIRARIAANHDAEVERFRAELETWGEPA